MWKVMMKLLPPSSLKNIFATSKEFNFFSRFLIRELFIMSTLGTTTHRKWILNWKLEKIFLAHRTIVNRAIKEWFSIKTNFGEKLFAPINRFFSLWALKGKSLKWRPKWTFPIIFRRVYLSIIYRSREFNQNRFERRRGSWRW